MMSHGAYLRSLPPPTDREKAAVEGWWNWHYNRGRMPMNDEKQIRQAKRRVSWRRAL